MTLYLDTSVIVKLYIREDDSDKIAGAVGEATAVITSQLAYPEACAAIEQRRRAKTISPGEAKAAKQAFELDWSSWFGIAIDEAIVQSSGRLAERHGLRGADAIHLASFERIVATSEDDDVRFLCADDRLSKAARSIG